LGRIAAVVLIYVPIALSSRLLLAPFTVMLGPMLQAACAGYLIVSFLLVRTGVGFIVLNTRIMRSIGLISYSLYIWQQPFLLAPPELFGAAAPWLAPAPSRILTCIFFAIASYWALERPLAALRMALHPKPPRGRADGDEAVDRRS
jgi:peptidoglycan/LPS O-acetylase OafA/YrhL